MPDAALETLPLSMFLSFSVYVFAPCRIQSSAQELADGWPAARSLDSTPPS
jgi:hypothetical protein